MLVVFKRDALAPATLASPEAPNEVRFAHEIDIDEGLVQLRMSTLYLNGRVVAQNCHT